MRIPYSPHWPDPTHILPFTESITQGLLLVAPLTHPFSSSSIQHGRNISVEESWAKLAANIRAIQHHNAHKLSFEECYRLSYQLVVSKQGQMLYDGVRDLAVENLNRLAQETILPSFPSGLEQDPIQQIHEGEGLLKVVHKVWSDHTDCMDILSDILKFMVRPTTRTFSTDLRMYALRTVYM